MSKNIPNRILLTENELPKQWYNVRADMPEQHDPFINPATMKPAVNKMYRPSPLHRAYNLEKALDTPAKIYYKYEGSNTSGSHKLNSAIAQAYYNKEQGITHITTETGAGQWGTALAMACSFYNILLDVYMVKISAEQKPYRNLWC